MSDLLEKKNVIKVKNYLNKFNENINLIVLDETARTAVDAANSLKKEVGAIVKSLLIKNENSNEFYLCLVSGDKYMSFDKLSKIINGKIIKADANECKKITGFSIGGISPIAHKTCPARILIDENLKKFSKIYAAAGHPYVVFEITFNSLCKITKGEVTMFVK